jgi:hypothetical protein
MRWIRRHRAERRVERPAGVDAADQHGPEREHGAHHVDVPAEQVEPRERQVARPDHHRDEEVAEHGGDRRDQEEEDHDDAVHGEQLVVGVGFDHVARRRQQLETNEAGEDAAEQEHHGDRAQIQQRDALVVHGEQPRANAVVGVQIMDAGLGWFHNHVLRGATRVPRK